MLGKIVAGMLGVGLLGLAAEPHAPLRLEGFDPLGRARLTQTNTPLALARLEASHDLVQWSELARLHGAFHQFPDLRAPTGQHFYRTLVSPRTSTDDWKNHAIFPEDPLLSPPPAWDRFEPRWLKFAILKSEPHRVYFQDSTKYPFHYDFAVERLPAFRGFSRAQFDAVSLRRDPQQVLLGAILFAPSDQLPEIGVQFVGQDPYPREDIATWFAQVRAVIEPRIPASFFYFPTFEQQAVADTHRDYFATRGITVASAARWVTADECYAPGWAIGRLVWVPAGDIRAAYTDGRLRPQDILLTDHVPAEVPPLAGLITLSPATPNSHVALLAQSFGIPFVFLSAPEAREEVSAWTGQEVALRATLSFGACTVKAVNLEGQLTPPTRNEILALKVPPRLELTRKASLGTLSLPAGDLRPADIRYVGGKAANFGLLRRSLPTNSPAPALAFTFDLWDAYLDQTLPNGQTLRATIHAELDDITWPPDMANLQNRLARLRELIRDTADFSPAQKSAILDILQTAGFDPDRNIRFRSSTNVEDSEQFSGAGLYDSYSGCLADDLDADRDGPSACDPTERERGVFRALRRVYASFCNDLCHRQRLRHRVDETTVGMAVLVPARPSPPARQRRRHRRHPPRHPTQRTLGQLASSPSGALPVTTQANALPRTSAALSGAPPSLPPSIQPSASAPCVFTWPSDWRETFRMLDQAFAPTVSSPPVDSPSISSTDKARPTPRFRCGRSVILPAPTPATARTQARSSSGRVRRRLRPPRSSLLDLSDAPPPPTAPPDPLPPSRRLLKPSATAVAPFRPTRTTATADPRRMDRVAVDARRFQLRTSVTPEDRGLARPSCFLPMVPSSSRPATPPPAHPRATGPLTLVDTSPAPPQTCPRSLRSSAASGKGLAIETAFYWPPNPTGPVAGYTAPVQAWIETRLTGLVSQPIVLHSHYARLPRATTASSRTVFDPPPRTAWTAIWPTSAGTSVRSSGRPASTRPSASGSGAWTTACGKCREWTLTEA
ncbi:MAG: hypothetical protein HS113_22075 [Verrucomicrobiales bacterium]|nr:hypothetical protein [Verrucomicrobiales bacterium]